MTNTSCNGRSWNRKITVRDDLGRKQPSEKADKTEDVNQDHDLHSCCSMGENDPRRKELGRWN